MSESVDATTNWHPQTISGAAQGQRYNECSACLSRHKIRLVNCLAMLTLNVLTMALLTNNSWAQNGVHTASVMVFIVTVGETVSQSFNQPTFLYVILHFCRYVEYS